MAFLVTQGTADTDPPSQFRNPDFSKCKKAGGPLNGLSCKDGLHYANKKCGDLAAGMTLRDLNTVSTPENPEYYEACWYHVSKYYAPLHFNRKHYVLVPTLSLTFYESIIAKVNFNN